MADIVVCVCVCVCASSPRPAHYHRALLVAAVAPYRSLLFSWIVLTEEAVNICNCENAEIIIQLITFSQEKKEKGKAIAIIILFYSAPITTLKSEKSSKENANIKLSTKSQEMHVC